MADVDSNDNGRSEDKGRDRDQIADSPSQDQRPKHFNNRENPKPKEPTTPRTSKQSSSEKSVHWEGVIHYQDARPRSESHQVGNANRSQAKSVEWQGVKESHVNPTDTKDREASKPPAAPASVTHSQEADRSSDPDRSMSR